MKEMIAETIWNEGGVEDFIEINFKVGNERLSVNFSVYTSIREIKDIWGNDLTGRILSEKRLSWKLQGSSAISVKLTGELINKRGIIELVFAIIFETQKEDNQPEECTIRLRVEPNELDIFCNQINDFKGKVGEVASIKAR